MQLNPLRAIKIYIPLSILFLALGCTQSENGQKAPAKATVPTYGTAPVIDSVYLTSYMSAEPRFKPQLDWAKKFYREHHFQPGWFKDHQLVPQAAEMLRIIDSSANDALDPKKYHIKDFKKLFADLKASSGDAERYKSLEKEIDVALSATYFLWAGDFYRGKMNPRENKGIEWDVKRNKIKLNKALLTVLNQRKSKYPYADFKPLHDEYTGLKSALASYRKIEAAGGWPQVPAGELPTTGKSSPTVIALAKRLRGAAAGPDSAIVLDDSLLADLKSFQQTQGLRADGKLGRETLRLLNIPVGERIAQLIVNMERWRWIPKSFETDYLLVNIPEYKLHVIEKGAEKITMNVIVGKTLSSTKVFSDKLEYVVLSPYWNVPISIVKNELAPKMLRNPGYLARMDMEVVDSRGKVVSASAVNWGAIGSNFKYTVRRRPGPKNDLGDVKFLFPNQNNIYFHDTPHDELFSQTKRNFSHGCVRLERPVDLAEYLLRGIAGWDRQTILNTIAKRKEQYVRLKRTIPVYLVYFTAWTDTDGRVHFRDDIYGHDAALRKMYFR